MGRTGPAGNDPEQLRLAAGTDGPNGYRLPSLVQRSSNIEKVLGLLAQFRLTAESDGTLTLHPGGGFAPLSRWIALAWYQTTPFHLGLLLITLLVFVTAVVAWLLGYRRRQPVGRETALAGLIGLLNLLFVVGLFWVLQTRSFDLILGATPLIYLISARPFANRLYQRPGSIGSLGRLQARHYRV